MLVMVSVRVRARELVSKLTAVQPRNRRLNVEQNLADDRLGGDSVELGLGIENQAVGQYRNRQSPHVIGSDVVAPVGDGPSASGVGQGDGTAHARAEPGLLGVAGGLDEPRDVVDEHRVDEHSTHQVDHAQQRLGRDDLGDVAGGQGRALENASGGRRVGVAQ